MSGVSGANVQRNPLPGFLNCLIQEPKTKLRATVVSAADAAYFVPLQTLVVSLRLSHECEIAVIDLGLSAGQRGWLKDHGCRLLKRPATLLMPLRAFMWQTWNKPLWIQVAGVACSDRPLLWIDADCIVTGSLELLDRLASLRPVAFADCAALHFNGWRDGTESVSNRAELYRAFPTPSRFKPGEPPNAGVLACNPWRREDARLLSCWSEMIARAAKDSRLRYKRSKSHDAQGWLRWYDQGALQWALEKLDRREWVIHDVRFNDPISAHGTKSLAELTHKIERLQTTRIIHFPCGSKPYGTFPKRFSPSVRHYPRRRTDLTLLVLGHERERLKTCQNVPHAKCVYLPDIDADNSLAESRIFASNHIANAGTEYVGLCTARWNEKYAGECRPLERLHELPMGVSRVWAARPAEPDWLELTERDHPGMRRILEYLAGAMGARNPKRRSVWSNNLIAHWSVVRGLQDWVWRGLGLAFAEFGPKPRYGMAGWDKTRPLSYLAERISMLYFCMRDDLEIVRAE